MESLVEARLNCLTDMILGNSRRIRYFLLTRAIASAERRCVLALLPLIRFLSSSDELSEKPSLTSIRSLVCSSTHDASFAVLAMTPCGEIDSTSTAALFLLLGDATWSMRATRALLSWSKIYSGSAIDSTAIWLSAPDALNVHQLRLALRIAADLAPYISESVARMICQQLLPIALARADPYSVNAVQLAQEAVAALLAEWPDLATEWSEMELDGVGALNRRAILALAFSAGRNLTVESHFGALTSSFQFDADGVAGFLQHVENKYSVAEELMPRKPARRLDWLSFPVPFFVVAGVAVTLVAAIAATRAQFVVSEPLPPVLDALLPLLGIVVAVHLLAIDLAAGRLPRYAIGVVATSPGILLAYGFLLSSIAYAYVGTKLGVLQNSDRNLWDLITLIISFAMIAIVVYSLLQAQDLTSVSRVLARRGRSTARRSAREYVEAATQNETWNKMSRDFRNIRRGLEFPVARRAVAIVSDRTGILRLDPDRLVEVDNLIEGLNQGRFDHSYRKDEIVLLKVPGSVVFRGEPFVAIAADEPNRARRIESSLRDCVKISARASTMRTADAVVAIGRMAAVTIKESEQSASREIVGYLQHLVEIGISRIRSSQDDTDPAPFPPAVSAVLALDRIYRDVLAESGEFMRELVGQELLTLARLSIPHPSSWLVEAVSARMRVLARDRFDSEEIATVIALWTQVGRVAFLAGRRGEGRMILEDIGNICVKIAKSHDREDVAGFCVERYAELLASTMYADYFASEEVMDGVKKISLIASNSNNDASAYVAALALIELGAAALAFQRYATAYMMLGVISDASINFDRAVESLRKPSISGKIQIKSSLAGEVFGIDVEEAVIRYHDWVTSLRVIPRGMIQ